MPDYTTTVPISDPSNTYFYVQAFNMQVDASSALIGALSDISFNSDVVSRFDCSLNVLQTLFRFSTDSRDIMDSSNNDILYQINYNRTENTLQTTDISGQPSVYLCNYDISNSCPIPLSSNWVVNTDCVGSDLSDLTFAKGTLNAANKAVAYEFTRYIAQKLFNTHLGVDLFQNEEFMRNDINIKARKGLDAKLKELYNLGTITDISSGKWCETDTYLNGKLHPSEVILRKIMDTFPGRLSNLNDYYISGNPEDISGNTITGSTIPVYKMPLAAGDAIVFQLTIKPNTNQKVDVGMSAGNIDDRKYRVIIYADPPQVQN